jgi:apolipoprotein N-acyltransferase
VNWLKKIPAWLISGVGYGLAWPAFPVETGWLAWVALVPMLLRLRRVRSFQEHIWLTLPAFLVALPILCWWLTYFSGWAMPMIWLTQGPFLWVPVALLYPMQRRIGWRNALLLLPLLWTVWEWVWLYVCDFNLGVGNPATTQGTLLAINQFADFTGQWGLLFWLVGFNVALALTIDRWQSASAKTRSIGRLAGQLALVAGGWLAGPLLYSAAVFSVPSLVISKNRPPVQVGLVQTNEDSYAPPTDSGVIRIVQRLIKLGTQAAQPKADTTQPRPDLIVAPEGAFPLPLLRDSALFAGMRQYVQYYDTPFATGLMTPIDSSHFYNEAFLFTPELSRIYEPMQLTPSDIQVYRKQHSLAFGERLPRLLTWAEKWLLPGKASVALGNAPYTFTFTDRNQNTRTVAIAICWEQLYPATIAALTRPGNERGPSEFLAFIMNDGWFYDSPGPRILLAITQLRAIENRRSVARCSNQGYSGYVDPLGRVVSVLPRQQEAIGTVSVMANTKLAFFSRHPDWFPIVCGLLFLALGFMYLRKTRRRHSGNTNRYAGT